ncbi:MAG: hypothetical protein M3N53_02935 [Actinomycetota bacterium]|nr:hypothetical protein [Actinomycetota bacterium]
MQPPEAPDEELAEVLLPVFTDEELAAVAEPDHRGERLVPLERVDGLSAPARAVAIEAGRRSLRARGYLDRAGEPLEESALGFVLATRRSPLQIVVAERLSDRAKRFLYGDQEEGVLEERVEDGLHFFRLAGVDRGAAELASFADPESWARDDAPALTSRGPERPSWQGEVEAAIAGADVVTRVFAVKRTARDRTDQVVVYVAARPDGVWVLSGLTDPEGTQVYASAKQVSAATLRAVMANCLRLQPGEVLSDERLD